MKPSFSLRPLLAAAVLAAAGLAQAGTVDVRFVEPAGYADAGRSATDRERTTDALGAHLRQLGARLPAVQALRVEVLDVDLAGRLEMQGPHEVRVLTGGADWPKLHLRWTLTEGDRTLASGEDRLADMNYLQWTPPSAAGTAYFHELRLLDRWFGERFGKPAD